MDCLVTGGAGFIGSHLVDALIDRGDRVTVIDNLSTGKRSNLEGALVRHAQLEVADITDREAVSAIFDAARPEIVFHLAAQMDVRHSVADPVFDATTNVLGTITLLAAALAAGARRFVNSSSGGAIYGEADVVPTPEIAVLRPMAPYGESKHAAEGYCALYARLHGMSTVSLRYGNVYGPRQDVHGEAGVVAIFCGHLVGGTRPTIFGDGRQTRDWVDVSDVVRAILRAVDSEVTGPVNIGHGRETSVLDLVEALNDASERGRLLDPAFEAERPGEVLRNCLDVSRAKSELGWEAQVDLREGLRTVLTTLWD